MASMIVESGAQILTGEAARIANVSPDTIRVWERSGRLSARSFIVSEYKFAPPGRVWPSR
jgi:hypothetical protein